MNERKGIRGLAVTVVAMTVLAAACGSTDAEPAAGGPGTDPSATTTVATTGPTVGGWIGGPPNWSAAGGVFEGAAEFEAGTVEADVLSVEEAPASEAPVDDVAIPVEPDGGIGDGAEPLPPDIEPPVQAPLRAGSVDDNVDYQGFLDYLARIDDIGVVLRSLDPSDRSVVTVTGANGLPVAGAEVTARAGDVAATLRTTADGTVRFHPSFYDMDPSAGVTFEADGAEAIVLAAAEDGTLAVPTDRGATTPVPLDVLFLLDATGSMGDEIGRLKSTIDVVADRVAALEPAPDVRFAMTLYRDEGDAFVSATYDFTADVAEFQAALSEVVAEGGGDYPEALDEGLAEALAAPSWREPADAVQLVFIVADAPPQIGRQVPVAYPDSIRTAIGRGIKIFPVASSESDDQAEAVFRQMAQATGAPFVFLSYGAGGAATGGSTDIQSTDYEELALDELVVRLIAEELNDLGGGEPITVPTTVAPSITNPDGQ
ncbi:MAG: VWA domain-containing protein [Ilumatobacteraceae bacterium]